MSELQAFCNSKKLKIESVMTGHDMPEGFDPYGYSYKVTLRYRGRRLTVPFFCGSMAGEPTAADVVSSLILDARCGEYDFDEFCRELGYDSDSRKAEKTWKACQAVAPKIRSLLGDDFEAFAEKEH